MGAREEHAWAHLENALQERKFEKISSSLKEWCALGDTSLNQLEFHLNEFQYLEAEREKIKILAVYYKNEINVALEMVASYVKKRGFDDDLFIVNLVALYLSNRISEAAEYMRLHENHASELMHRGDYWQMRASILWAMNDFSDLEISVDRALQFSGGSREVLEIALAIYIEIGAEEKIQSAMKALDQASGRPGYGHALNLLALGLLDDGFEMMEVRYDIPDAHRFLNQGLFQCRRWQGESLGGRRLLISAEQGLGDTVQMARYLSFLSDLNCASVQLEVQKEALELLQYNYPDIPMVERKYGEKPAFNFDAWIGLMSLPLRMKKYGKGTPGRNGYLRVPEENRAYWGSRVADLCPAGRLKIGLAWSGQPLHRADKRRSIPFEMVMRYVREAEACFFAVQTYVPPICPNNLKNLTEELITLADTAALIQEMDVVITVDTSVVHLAGALGKETWLLLPARYEWRWGLEGEDNDWYDSVKVMRQIENGNWLPLLDDVFARIACFSTEKNHALEKQ